VDVSAPSVKDILGSSPNEPGVTVAPAAGQGVTLDAASRLPVASPAQAVPHVSADPDVLSNGMVWVRSDLAKLRFRAAGATVSLAEVAAAVYPWTVSIDVFGLSQANTNWSTVGTGSGFVKNAARTSSGAANDEVTWDVLLGAGTWSLQLMYQQASDQGVYTVQLASDGVTFVTVNSSPYNASTGTIDAYTAGTTNNVTSTITGITVSSSGIYRLKLKMASKNASSSSYVGKINGLVLVRTA